MRDKGKRPFQSSLRDGKWDRRHIFSPAINRWAIIERPYGTKAGLHRRDNPMALVQAFRDFWQDDALACPASRPIFSRPCQHLHNFVKRICRSINIATPTTATIAPPTARRLTFSW